MSNVLDRAAVISIINGLLYSIVKANESRLRKCDREMVAKADQWIRACYFESLENINNPHD